MTNKQDELLPCPFCGHKPFRSNLIDSLHPTGLYEHYDEENDVHHFTNNPEGALREVWVMACLENEGGCGAQVSGFGKDGAITAWNTRPTPSDEVRERNEGEPEDVKSEFEKLLRDHPGCKKHPLSTEEKNHGGS